MIAESKQTMESGRRRAGICWPGGIGRIADARTRCEDEFELREIDGNKESLENIRADQPVKIRALRRAEHRDRIVGP